MIAKPTAGRLRLLFTAAWCGLIAATSAVRSVKRCQCPGNQFSTVSEAFAGRSALIDCNAALNRRRARIEDMSQVTIP